MILCKHFQVKTGRAMIEGEFKQGMTLEVQKKTKKDIRHKVRQSEHCRLETEVKLQALAKQLNTQENYKTVVILTISYLSAIQNNFQDKLYKSIKASWRTLHSSHSQSSDLGVLYIYIKIPVPYIASLTEYIHIYIYSVLVKSVSWW